MEIKINLNDVLYDAAEGGEAPDSIEEVIRAKVVETLTRDLRKRLDDQVNRELGAAISVMIKQALEPRMEGLISNILDAEFTPVDRYGDRKKVTTFRRELINCIHEEMKYVPKSSSYDENIFTRTIKESMSKHINEFKAAYNKKVDDLFTAEALSYAQKRLAERLGLSK